MVTDAAYARCLEIARRHYENFPVASHLLPRAMRPHVAAIYAFARTADDFADEGDRSDAERLALLDDWRERLHGAARLRHGYGGQAAGGFSADDRDTAAIFRALGVTMRRHDLELRLFDDLLSAFRQDVLVKRYETWDDVTDYCRRSANPVGRLVLRLAGYRDARLDDLSDAICTALQLTNFWQDLHIDWRKGRLYVPLALVRDSGADERDLDRENLTPEWRTALASAASTTRALFLKGRALPDAVRGRLKWELRATWLGGVHILDRIEAARFDVQNARPTLGWTDGLAIAIKMVAWAPESPVVREQ
ncbi:MAG TPA: squalene synthase HpnC [Vicinamibacterales bacterium]|nr:squalene synthase HpnC [Vicinamibacterales bacterium]